MTASRADVDAALASLMRADHGRLLAALIANLRDFQLAEDVLQDAITSAISHWMRAGLPSNPAGWILQTARRKAIDRLRRKKNFDLKSKDYGVLLMLDQKDVEAEMAQEIPDERLRLIFTCCHPAIDPKTRVALTLRTLGGLTTAEIARAFLDSEPAMAQRLVRARQKISKAGVPFKVPEPQEWDARLHSVLTVIYLVFNEGYAVLAGDRHIRVDLCEEAIYLAQVVDRLRPDEPEIEGLLALLTLIHSRRAGRVAAGGAMIALQDQDRHAWDLTAIERGGALVEKALRRGRAGAFQIQAAIQALHCQAENFAATDWAEIEALYRVLLRIDGSAVVQLNHAVALSYARSPSEALKVIAPLADELQRYQPYYAAKADFLAREAQDAEARSAYDKAIALSQNPSEVAYLRARRDALKPTTLH